MPSYTPFNFGSLGRGLLAIIAAGTLGGLSPARAVAAAETPDVIVQRGFDAFSRGTLGNSGANLYVSRRGRVQVIDRWDLNGDGYNDLVFSSDHDESETVDALVYWGSKHGFSSLLPDLWQERPLAQVAFGLMDGSPGVTRLPAAGGGKSLVLDLNKDGYPDIVFCNYIHNYPGVRTACIYWGGASGYKPSNRTELPTLWAAGVAAADLNGDGYPDLVFANQGTEAGLDDIRNVSESGSYIYWGSATGFDVNHRTELPTHGAVDVTIADINHDGHPDIAFINNSPRGRDVQIFFGSAQGYSPAHTQTLPIPDPTSIRSGDLNRDGYADLVVTTSAPPQTIGPAGLERGKRTGQCYAYLLLGSAAGIAAEKTVRLPTLEARDSLVGDFNHDGWPDIAIANSSDGHSPCVPSYVYWGSPDGFSPGRRTELPTLGANGVACADLNGDGALDLIFANSSNGRTADVPSYIYWGSPTGYAPYLRSDLQSFGAVSVSAADLNGDGIPEVVLVNQYSGHIGEINSRIYWGNPHHYYSTASMTSLPGHGAYGTAAADLTDNGHCDFVLCNYYQDSSYIYWGGSDGFFPAHRQVVDVGASLHCAVSDLNRDGYLDLIFVGTRHGKNISTILWGSADGYADAHQTVLELKTRRAGNVTVADLNHDGYLDLIYNDEYFGTMQIFWGSAQGYSSARSWFHASSGGSLKLADLNGDGYLDFIISGGFDPKKKSPNTKTRIFWGTPAGTPSFENGIELEAYQSCEVAIADLKHDGRLDLVAGNYMSETTRSLPIFIFWGDKQGRFSDQHRLELPAESSCGVEVLDLNRDGYPEIIVHNHLKDGVHSIGSYIYWNGPKGFDKDRRTELPAFGPHYTTGKDPGNLYTRKLEEEYISAALAIPAGKHPTRLKWEAQEPHGAKLHFQVRTAAAPGDLAHAPWQPADSSALDGVADDARWIQYRALFTSPDAGEWPILSEVEIQLK